MPSASPVARVLPSGLNATAVTARVGNAPIWVWVARSHSRAVPSPPTVARVLPSGLNTGCTVKPPGWPTKTLHQVFDTANGWTLSGTGPYYQCIQTFGIPVPGGGPGGPLAGHTLQCVASLVSQGAQIVSIVHSNPFVLI